MSDLNKKDRNKRHSSPFINVVKGVFFVVRVTTDLFVDNILPCIEKEVHSQEDNMSEINNRIHISLTSENIRKQENIDIGEEINTNKEILSIKYIDIDQDM